MDLAYRRMVTILGSGFIGVFIAAMLFIMNAQGVLVDEFVGQAVSLPELMGLVIVLFILLGVVLAAFE